MIPSNGPQHVKKTWRDSRKPFLHRLGEFILDADASNTAVGVVLSQKQDGEERVIAYFSKGYRNQRQIIVLPGRSC